MCLAIPGKVMQIDRNATPIMGKVSFGGIQKDVCLEWVPEVQVGQYVIVHVGFALQTMDEQEALETLRLFEEAGNSLDELDADDADQTDAEPKE
jgi:hydrogenase expression/formation protein HypC